MITFCPSSSFRFKKNSILLFMLLQLAHMFPLCPPPPSPLLPQAIPTLLSRFMGPRIYVLWILYSLCCTLHPHGYSVTTNLHFLIPSHFSPNPLPSGNHQNVLCIYDFVSLLLVHLFCFFRFTCRYVFIAILLFIFLIFLKKTP